MSSRWKVPFFTSAGMNILQLMSIPPGFPPIIFDYDATCTLHKKAFQPQIFSCGPTGTCFRTCSSFACVQARRDYSCLRNNHLSLIVMPCPRTLLFLLCDCQFVLLKLATSGNTEANPGLLIFHEKLEQILKILKEHTKTLISNMMKGQNKKTLKRMEMLSGNVKNALLSWNCAYQTVLKQKSRWLTWPDKRNRTAFYEGGRFGKQAMA